MWEPAGVRPPNGRRVAARLLVHPGCWITPDVFSNEGSSHASTKRGGLLSFGSMLLSILFLAAHRLLDLHTGRNDFPEGPNLARFWKLVIAVHTKVDLF
jgi:hypothetical protein